MRLAARLRRLGLANVVKWRKRERLQRWTNLVLHY